MSDGNGAAAAGGGEQAGAASADDILGGAAAAGGEGQGGAAGAGAGGEGGAGAGGEGEGGANGAADPDWYQQLSAEADGEEPSLRDWAKSRGYKTLDDVVKSARDNQKAVRDSGRIKVPGDDAAPEDVATFRKAIGVPDDPKGYKLPELKGEDGEPIPLNTTKLQNIASIAHKHGIPAKALEATLQEIAEADALELSTTETEIQSRAEAHAAKWGAQRAEKVAAVGRGLEALGLTRDEALAIRAAITPERALDIFAKLGAGIGEDTMVDGGGRQRFGVSGAEAQKQLDAKRADPEWVKKAMVPGTPENAEYTRLNNAVGAAADRKAREDA